MFWITDDKTLYAAEDTWVPQETEYTISLDTFHKLKIKIDGNNMELYFVNEKEGQSELLNETWYNGKKSLKKIINQLIYIYKHWK